MSTDTTGPAVRGNLPLHGRDSQNTVTLDSFGAAVASACGVRLSDLSPIDELEIHTRNSCYRITVIDPGEGRILVQGGAFFPVACQARLGGASLGGSMLKLGWIGYGFCLEIHDSRQCIVTTPVREIRRISREMTAPC